MSYHHGLPSIIPQLVQWNIARVSRNIHDAVIQAEVRKMPRTWEEVKPELGYAMDGSFFEQYKAAIMEVYLRQYYRYFKSDPANNSNQQTRPRGGMPLYNFRDGLDEAIRTCVVSRHNVKSWNEAAAYLQTTGRHSLKELAQHKYYILERFLAHWADSVARNPFPLYLFVNDRSRFYYPIMADVHASEPLICRDVVENMGMTKEIRDGRVRIDCMARGYHIRRMVTMTFTVVDRQTPESRGVTVSSDMDWWIWAEPLTYHDQMELENDPNPEMEGEMEGV